MWQGYRFRQGGFTLIEIMIVLVILGIMASMLVPKIMDRPSQARVTKTKTDIQSIESALKLYKLDNGFYPSQEQGLKALLQEPETEPKPKNYRGGGYLEGDEVPTDAWDNPYIYRKPGDNNRPYEIISRGADGKEGGDGANADIKSWQID